MTVLRLFLLLGLSLSLAEPPVVLAGDGDGPGGETAAPGLWEGTVIANRLDVFEGPSESALATLVLEAGATVRVRFRLKEGWLAIDPPPLAFDWIDVADLRIVENGRAWVDVPTSQVRLGRPNARLPGPPSVVLRKGTPVRLIERPSLQVSQPRGTRVWRAIDPPSGEVRYVRAEGTQLSPRVVPKRVPMPPLVMSGEVPAAFRVDALEVPSRIAPELSLADALHKSVLRDPIGRWDLDPVWKRYQALRDVETDPKAIAILDGRLAEVARETAVSRSARTFEQYLESSRARDAEVAAIQRRLETLRTASERSFNARGLLQPTSRRVDGIKVPALINGEGKVLAYLQVPVGFDLPLLYGRKVGVRGEVRFDETLGARLIIVRDLEPLDRDR